MNDNLSVYDYLSVRLRRIFQLIDKNITIKEIRLRAETPLLIHTDRGEIFLSDNGLVTTAKYGCIVTKRDIKETLEYISNYSLYAYEEEIKNGYITMPGGNRIGICGRVVTDDKGIKTIRNISFINIRMAHEIIGCGDKLMDKIFSGKNLLNTLIVSPPCCGKTTLIRDLIRNLSDGNCAHKGQTVGLVDERSEIAACCHGIPQNHVGIRTDVLDGCPKVYGMQMLIRSMAPQIIAVDEIGSIKDSEAIEYAVNCGCKIIATIHGTSYNDIKEKKNMKFLIENIFNRIIVLGDMPLPGTLVGIYDERGNQI